MRSPAGYSARPSTLSHTRVNDHTGVTGMSRSHCYCALAIWMIAAGCAESTLVRSYPPASTVYLNGEQKGITPLALTVPRAQFNNGTFRVRVEHEGYESAERTLTTQTCNGRIVGGVFTVGILLLFKPPTCFVSPQDFALNPLPGASPRAEATPAHRESTEERLQRLQELRQRGVISNEEYDRSRQQILQGN